MNTLPNSTSATKQKDIQRNWHLIDVNDKILGRVAARAAQYLIGKSKPYFVPHLDCGDHVIITNAAGIQVTGKKESQKTYDSFSGYPGGRKEKTYVQVKKENPERILHEAIAGMLPKNKLRASMLKRLHIFAGAEHDYKDKIK